MTRKCKANPDRIGIVYFVNFFAQNPSIVMTIMFCRFLNVNSRDFLEGLSLLFHTNRLGLVDTNREIEIQSQCNRLHSLTRFLADAELHRETYPFRCNCSLEAKHHTEKCVKGSYRFSVMSFISKKD